MQSHRGGLRGVPHEPGWESRRNMVFEGWQSTPQWAVEKELALVQFKGELSV